MMIHCGDPIQYSAQSIPTTGNSTFTLLEEFAIKQVQDASMYEVFFSLGSA
jgi:hypothetical protein